MVATSPAAARTSIGYRLVDADQHYYEPYDAFNRYLEPEFRDRAVHIVKGDDGLGRVYIGDKRSHFMSVIQTDYIGPPGAHRDFFEGRAKSRSERRVINAHDYPAFMSREPRLKLMDEQGVEAVIMLPTLGVGVEHDLYEDIPAACASLRAFNRWLEEEWGFGADGRIFSAPMLTLADLDFALAELDYVLKRGAKLIHFKAGPVPGAMKSPADPMYDRFWSVVQDANLLVAFHVGNTAYPEILSAHWGEDPHPRLQRVTAFQQLTSGGYRTIHDTMAALVLHNLFGRFPGVRVLSIENGSAWVEPLLHGMDKVGHHAFSEGLGGKLTDEPSRIFKQHVWVSPFYEEDLPALADLIGPEQVLFGSDFPHPEGLSQPVEYLDSLKGLGDETVRTIMRTNTARLLGLDTAKN